MKKSVTCPECKGRGENIEARLYPAGYTEVWVVCEVCEGISEFEEDSYLVMKLASEI